MFTFTFIYLLSINFLISLSLLSGTNSLILLAYDAKAIGLLVLELAIGNSSRDGETSSETSRAADEETRGAGTETGRNGGGDES